MKNKHKLKTITNTAILTNMTIATPTYCIIKIRR